MSFAAECAFARQALRQANAAAICGVRVGNAATIYKQLTEDRGPVADMVEREDANGVSLNPSHGNPPSAQSDNTVMRDQSDNTDIDAQAAVSLQLTEDRGLGADMVEREDANEAIRDVEQQSPLPALASRPPSRKHRIADDYTPYVIERYAEFAIAMKCKVCGIVILLGFNCNCVGSPTPNCGGVQFALDGLRVAVLSALKDACKNPQSTEVTVMAPCPFDAFLRLFCLLPDMVNNAASASIPPPGMTYTPAAAHAETDPRKRAGLWKERHYEIIIAEENAALRLLDLRRANADSLTCQAWKSLYVHGKSGTACAAVVPLRFVHRTNNKTKAGESLSVTFSTFKMDGAQGSRMPCTMERNIQNKEVNFGGRWLKLFWTKCEVQGMDVGTAKNHSRLKHKKAKMIKASDGGGESVGGDGGSGGDDSAPATTLYLESTDHEAY